MTDLLEELLKALEEEEQDCDVLALTEPWSSGAQEKPLPPSPEETGPVRLAAGAYRDTEAAAEQPDLRLRKRRSTGDLADRMLREIETADLLARKAAGEPSGIAGTGGRYARMADQAAAARGYSAGSAAALERRLARSTQPVPAARTAQTVAVTEMEAGSGVDLAELDRRVERDARRYDGGLTLY